MTTQIAVCGPRDCTPEDTTNAHRIGELLADAGATVLCGGGTGVMAAVAAGVRSRNGLVIGIRPGDSREDASPDLSAVIVTNMGEARNAILVWSADAVIIVGGSWGTLSELALAHRRGGIPVISIGGWSIHGPNGEAIPGTLTARTPEQAVELSLTPEASSAQPPIPERAP
ncbi:LOG family protein [Longispora albida]|uniref:SLOG cluster 4 domain-containing protein n=1 Tax=Longispora albida TaxID=203523 RepID=UPI0003A852EF|nr:LOG family protein [Longispora albida]